MCASVYGFVHVGVCMYGCVHVCVCMCDWAANTGGHLCTCCLCCCVQLQPVCGVVKYVWCGLNFVALHVWTVSGSVWSVVVLYV